MVDVFPIVVIIWLTAILVHLFKVRLTKALAGLIISTLGLFIFSEGVTFGTTIITLQGSMLNYTFGVVSILMGLLIFYGNMTQQGKN